MTNPDELQRLFPLAGENRPEHAPGAPVRGPAAAPAAPSPHEPY